MLQSFNMATPQIYDVWLGAKTVIDLAAILLFMWMSKFILDVVFSALEPFSHNRSRSLMNEENEGYPSIWPAHLRVSGEGIPGNFITINLQYWYNPSCYDGEIESGSKSARKRSSDTSDSGAFSSGSESDDEHQYLFSPEDLRSLLNEELSFFNKKNWSVVLNVNKTSGFSETKICPMCDPSEGPLPMPLPVIHVTSITFLNQVNVGKPPFPDTKNRILTALSNHWMDRCYVYIKSKDETPIKY